MKYIITLSFIMYLFTISCKTNENVIVKDNQGVFVYTLNGKKGLVNLNSKELINPIYEEISELSEGRYTAGRIINNKLKFGFLDTLGVEITKFIFEDAYPFKNGFSAVKKNGKWTFLNRNFVPISDFKFKMVKDFNNGIAEVQSESGKWSFINEQGKLITKLSFDKTNKFTNGMAMIMQDGKYGYIGTSGKIQVEPIYIGWREFSKHQVALVSTKENGWRIVNKKGIIIPRDKSISVDYPFIFDNGLFRVVENINGEYKYGYMNLNEEIKVPIIYNHLEGFFNHNICGGIIDINGKKINCLITENGKILKKTNYSYIRYYYKGKVAIVYSKFDSTQLKKMKLKIGDINTEYFTSESLVGAIDYEGKEVIPTIYKSLSPLYAQYRDKNKYFNNQCLFKATKLDSKLIGVLSDYNEIIVPFEYTDIFYIYDDAFLVKKDKNTFIYKSKSNKKIPLNDLEVVYYTQKQFKENYIVVKEKNNNLVGLIDTNGNWIIKPKYEKLMFSEKKFNR